MQNASILENNSNQQPNRVIFSVHWFLFITDVRTCCGQKGSGETASALVFGRFERTKCTLRRGNGGASGGGDGPAGSAARKTVDIERENCYIFTKPPEYTDEFSIR